MGIMTGGAVFLCRLVGNAFLPIFGNFLMTGKTEIRLIFFQDFRLRGTMGGMTSPAILAADRRMNMSGLRYLAAHGAMAGKTLLPRIGN